MSGGWGWAWDGEGGGIIGIGQGAANWWEAGGASGCVAAYQPKGAASLAASYIDLTGNGNDASPVAAPDWDAMNGWKFGGCPQCLDTGITPASGYSMLVQFTNLVGATGHIAGEYTATPDSRFYLGPQYVITDAYYGAGDFVYVTDGSYSQGNAAVAGQQGYKDGSPHGGVIGPWTVPAGDTVGIGGRNPNVGPSNCAKVYIQAFAIYNNTLTAPQVLAVATAMAAL